jgi:hypothetical protein
MYTNRTNCVYARMPRNTHMHSPTPSTYSYSRTCMQCRNGGTRTLHPSARSKLSMHVNGCVASIGSSDIQADGIALFGSFASGNGSRQQSVCVEYPSPPSYLFYPPFPPLPFFPAYGVYGSCGWLDVGGKLESVR